MTYHSNAILAFALENHWTEKHKYVHWSCLASVK